MNWGETVDGLLLIGAWMAGSMTVAVVCAWAIPRYFPRKPEDEYTYVIKTKNGKKTIVVLPPELSETEREKVMNEAYQRLGIHPESTVRTP